MFPLSHTAMHNHDKYPSHDTHFHQAGTQGMKSITESRALEFTKNIKVPVVVSTIA
jgi:hypothetical protein